MLPVPEVSDVEAIFPANVVGSILPAKEDIPEEFHSKWHYNSFKPCHTAESIFFKGGMMEDYGYRLKKELEPQRRMVYRALQAALRSFEPSHEHKIVGVGYMISEWFEEIPDKPQEA